MIKKKKRIKRVGVLALCLIMLMTTGIIANAATYENTFSFTLESGGGKSSTSSRTKTNTKNYAAIDFTTYSNKSSYGLCFRLRSGTNDTAASNLYTLSAKGLRCPSYSSGYGQKNFPYYFRIQTDSNSAYSAKVAGSWRP